MVKHIYLYIGHLFLISDFVFTMTSINVPKRPRSSMWLHSSRVNGEYNVSVMFKDTRYQVYPLTASSQNSSIKIPFGPPTDCHYVSRVVSNDIVREFQFTNNRNQTVSKPDFIFNNLASGVNSFTQLVSSIYGKNKELLAIYISKINFGESFVHHQDGIHDSDGFSISDNGATESRIKDAGGSLDEYRTFIERAKENAKVVSAPLQDISNTMQRKSKDKQTPNPPKKRKIIDNEDKENNDTSGLERPYSESFAGVLSIPIAKLSVAQEMKDLIHRAKVETIKSNIKKRYDPSQSVLVVCQVDGSKSAEDVYQDFYVIQKINCFQALKELHDNDEFIYLSGHTSGHVLCYLLDTSRADMMVYGSVRENLCYQDYGARRNSPSDLLFKFKCLTNFGFVKDDALKAICRMAKLSRMGPDEISAVSKLCNWTPVGFASLIDVLCKYASYMTLDVKRTGHQQALARGDPNVLPNTLFKLLAKVTEQYFLMNYSHVLNNEISLKSLILKFKEKTDVDKVYKAIESIPSSEKFSEVLKKYPDKFEYNKMKEFVGAVCTLKDKNQMGCLLERYYKKVLESYCEDVEVPVQHVTVSDIEKVFEEFNIMEDSIIVMFMSDKFINIIGKIVAGIIKSTKDFHAAILIFQSEKQYFKVLSHLRSMEATVGLIQNYKVIPQVFTVDGKVKVPENIRENVKYGVLFGKFVHSNTLDIGHENLSCLSTIITGTGIEGPIAVVVDEGFDCVKVHSNSIKGQVTYYAREAIISKLKKMLTVEKSTAKDNSDELEDSGYVSQSTSSQAYVGDNSLRPDMVVSTLDLAATLL